MIEKIAKPTMIAIATTSMISVTTMEIAVDPPNNIAKRNRTTNAL